MAAIVRVFVQRAFSLQLKIPLFDIF